MRAKGKYVNELEKKQIEIKEEPFIECHFPLQKLSLQSYDHSLSYYMINKREEK